MKIIQTFINPSSCYIAIKKSQQIFHTTFVINFIIKNLILVGTNKLLSVGTCILLLSRLEANIFLATKKICGKNSHNYNSKSSASAYFKRCKSSQLHYQNKYLCSAKIYFSDLLKVSLFFVFRTSYYEFLCLCSSSN